MSNAQTLIGVIIVLACFTLLIIYAIEERALDAVIAAIIGGSVGSVTGFFFGHANGTTSALATAATALANRTNPGEIVSEVGPDVPVSP